MAMTADDALRLRVALATWREHALAELSEWANEWLAAANLFDLLHSGVRWAWQPRRWLRSLPALLGVDALRPRGRDARDIDAAGRLVAYGR